MPEPETPPAGGTPPATPPEGGTPPATPPAGGTPPADPIELAKKVGELELVKKEYEEYRQKADPVLETLWSDSELLKQATAAHNKRLGKPAGDTPPAPGDTPPTPPAGNSDERLSQINMISEGFETKAGISDLPAEKKAEVRGKIGAFLKDMLDPKGNKTIPQVFEEVSLVKLPWYLEQAWKLINRDNEIAAAREAGKTEVLSGYDSQAGLIGSMAGSSIPIDQVTLSPQEKKAAGNMGVSEEDYLKYKKKKITENS